MITLVVEKKNSDGFLRGMYREYLSLMVVNDFLINNDSESVNCPMNNLNSCSINLTHTMLNSYLTSRNRHSCMWSTPLCT